MKKPDSNPNEPPSASFMEDADSQQSLLTNFLEYFRLLQRNPRFRLYLISHLCQHVGDWFTRIASLLTIERLAPGSGKALSILALTRMIPQVFVSHIGGVFADKYDRRNIMRCLDCIGAVAVLFVLVAIRLDSLPMFYVVSVIRSIIHSLYEPSTKSIVPMIVPEPSSLKRAATLSSMAWAFMLVLGGVIAGDSTAYIGVQVCYVIDSATYFISAIVISFLKGKYSVVQNTEPSTNISTTTTSEGSGTIPAERNYQPTMYRLRLACQPLFAFCQMAHKLNMYLYHSGFGGVILLKATGALIWGPADVLNVSFAHVNGDEVATSKRLGYLFSCLGIGYVLGPIAANFHTNAAQPKSLQLVCASSFIFMTIGWIGISQAPTFNGILWFSMIRAFGSGIMWMNSTLLLQSLSKPEFLGRMLAFEFSLSMLADAVVAMIVGQLQDQGFAASQISSGVGALSGLFFGVWSVYHLFGRGAARKEFNPKETCHSTRHAKVEPIVVFA